MNGIYIETHDHVITQPMALMPSQDGLSINAASGLHDGWRIAVTYQTTTARDRAWAMLENAIATGVRLFRFPTDEEMEKGEDE